MMNGQDTAPPTVESLSAELVRARQLLDLFRQQRDRALAAANDLEAELAIAQQKLREAEPPATPLSPPAEPEHAVD